MIVNNSQQANQLQKGETAGDSYVIAFDRKTGTERWRRKGKSSNVAYSVPCIYERNGKAELICCNSTEGMFSLDPATGKQNWLLPVFKRRTVSSPYVVGDLVFGSTGSGGGGNYLVAVRPGEKPEVAYQIEQAAPYVPSSIAYKDMAFLFSDGKIGGVLTCIDSTTGEVHFKKRLGAAFFGCPVRAGNTIYCVDEDGMCYVVDAAKEFKLHSKIDLGETCRSTPRHFRWPVVPPYAIPANVLGFQVAVDRQETPTSSLHVCAALGVLDRCGRYFHGLPRGATRPAVSIASSYLAAASFAATPATSTRASFATACAVTIPPASGSVIDCGDLKMANLSRNGTSSTLGRRCSRAREK